MNACLAFKCNFAGDVGHHYYGPGHPMKPHRMKMAHHLLLGYGIYRDLHVHVSL